MIIHQPRVWIGSFNRIFALETGVRESDNDENENHHGMQQILDLKLDILSELGHPNPVDFGPRKK